MVLSEIACRAGCLRSIMRPWMRPNPCTHFDWFMRGFRGMMTAARLRFDLRS
jgi:hypothetical protein